MRKIYGIQILGFIRIFFFVCVLSVLCVPTGRALDSGVPVTQKKLSIRSGTLSSVFDQIRKQTGMDFFYNADAIDTDRVIGEDLRDLPLTEILDRVLGDRLTYSLKDNYILITERKNGPAPQSGSYADIRGRVGNEAGQPLKGATVRISGTKMTVVTGDDGTFAFRGIAASDKIVLEITYVGKHPEKVEYKGKFIEVVMKEAKSEMDTVVITGFFPRIKEGFAGAVTTLTSEDLKKVSTGNIFTSISLFDPSFQILENNIAGSNPNVLPEFIMRGKGSFQSENIRPLFILDGVEVSVETIFDLNVDRIESVTILKDASAAILYGSRAADGVVVIETKLPKLGDLRVSYTFHPTIAFADLTGYDLMNAAEKLEYERLAGFYGEDKDASENESRQTAYYSRLRSVMEGVNTYWLSQPVRNSFSQRHTLRIDGGIDQISYGIDGGYDNIQGVMKGSSREIISFGLTLGYRVRNSINVQNRVSYSYTTANETPYGRYDQYAKANPYERIYDKNGKLIPLLMDGKENPLYDATLANRDVVKSQNLSEQVSLDWIISPDFRLRGQASAVVSHNESENYVSPLSSKFVLETNYNAESGLYDHVPLEERGSLSVGSGNSMNLSGNATISYNKRFFGKHVLYTGMGSEFQIRSFEDKGFVVTGFSDDRFSSASYAMQYQKGSKATSSEQTSRTLGFFANLNYIFDNRFFIDLSGRYDGSSTTGVDKKYSLFWSAGAGWNIHNEPIFKNGKFIDVLRLRGSYGVTGRQAFSAYQAKTMYVMATGTTYRGIVPASIRSYGNPELKWQDNLNTNVGMELAVADRRISLSFNYYRRLTMNTVTDITVAPSIGLKNNSYTANLGKILNSGYDFSINTVLLRNRPKEMEFSIRFQGSCNKSKVLKISNALKKMYITNSYLPTDSYVEGQPMELIRAVESLGIDPQTGLEIYRKADGSLTYEWDPADLVVAGIRAPKLRGNIMPNFRLGNWNLNLAFAYSLGADYYNRTLAMRVEGADPRYNADRRAMNDRWIKPGDRTLFRNINNYTDRFLSSRFVQRENYIQLRSASLSYELSREFLKRLGMDALRLSAYTNDLFRISTIKEERGLEYPFAQSYVFELSVMF